MTIILIIIIIIFIITILITAIANLGWTSQEGGCRGGINAEMFKSGGHSSRLSLTMSCRLTLADVACLRQVPSARHSLLYIYIYIYILLASQLIP